MILAILKSLMVWKYRWIILDFKDGTRLVGVVPHKTWEETMSLFKKKKNG